MPPRKGARVLLVDCNAAGVAAAAASLRALDGSGSESLVADLADPASVAAMAETVRGVAGRLDILVNNAGIELDLPFEQVTPELFDRVIAVNLRAPLQLTQALISLFPPAGGAIVNISSIHAEHAFPNAIPYACSKAGLVALTRNLALELAPRKVRVNAICPGYIDTPIWDEWLRSSTDPETLARETTALHPLGRRGQPQDVASAVAYLAPGRSSPSPSTLFCDLVHGFGAHEEQTCARSDNPAKERCRATRRSHVYPCYVGLTDIAVPVICEDRYLGTLFSGQVLMEPPTPAGFAQVRKALEGQAHIDMARLEEAYFRLPVVTSAQLAEMVRMMEVFARYLANAWKRLEIIREFQQMRERELTLDRRELAERLLSGQMRDDDEAVMDTARTLARNVGLDRFPDSVLLLRLQDAGDYGDRASSGPGPSASSRRREWAANLPSPAWRTW
jgi:NAD(P)-dependent dehydrogenase (short-subunit alcohol dehydrogenase family)